MVDSNGNKVKNGDQIKTSRGVVLEIIERDGELYMFNSGNGQESNLNIINVDFYILDKEGE